jgi:hypothetical protein
MGLQVDDGFLHSERSVASSCCAPCHIIESRVAQALYCPTVQRRLIHKGLVLGHVIKLDSWRLMT